jgi:urea transport system ATP-binding protein
VTVLHEGAVLSEGSLEHVQSDERVVKAYLGRGQLVEA